MPLDANKIVLLIGERIRDKAADNIPYRSGDARKSLDVNLVGEGIASVGGNLVYLRALHDGRPAITIKPNISINPPKGNRKHQDPKRARLKFQIGSKTVFAKQVKQPARKGNPFLRNAAEDVQREGFDFLDSYLSQVVEKDVLKQIKGNIKIEINI